MGAWPVHFWNGPNSKKTLGRGSTPQRGDLGPCHPCRRCTTAGSGTPGVRGVRDPRVEGKRWGGEHMAEKLTTQSIQGWLQGHSGWARKSNTLIKEFKFGSFRD